ncbi:hypothetical protein SAMN04490190_2501 [Pseudomonas libanensis]|uniref:Uncharacterized protein n=1 Tax=Pseudomonas libanensis TaxID=75588 RepID=A0A0R2YD20_9PSED|nr:hypothetical protein [Pseudomonas libanensis]KRP46183.1 hypothetical protein TU73_09450 [Pseudomonas libanensis]SDK95356.1 hypothetical protein SAMN04490190_2501 [Pseudomonas libanensis]
MLEKPILRQVVGWVVVVPLLVSFLRLPFPLGWFLIVGSIAASVYGVRFALRHASRRVTFFALVMTVLNVISSVMIGYASVPMALYRITWLYWYPYYSSWIYWNF